MERLLRTGVVKVQSVDSNAAVFMVVPLRLAKMKVARIKAVRFIVPMILQTNGNQVYVALINRPQKQSSQYEVGTFTPTMEDMASNAQLIAQYYSRAVLGVAPTSFQSTPEYMLLPEPYIYAINDLTLMLMASATSDLVVGVDVYYDQKTVSLEDWQLIAKEY